MKYKIVYSSRKTLAMQIQPDGDLLIRAPYKCPVQRIEWFIEQKIDWIEKHRAKQKKRNLEEGIQIPTMSQREQRKFHQQAVKLFHSKAAYFAAQMDVTYNRIFVKSQKTRFGSCSSKRNLNFNQCLLFAPEKVLDYVVIHELSHLKEMNHSSAFWAIVQKEMPDYKVWKKWLKDFGHQLK